MAIPSVTNTFVNGTSSDAGQVNTNFTDLINSLTDGTKSLTIDALTANGAATFNGNVTLGDGTPDDITFNGSIASTIPVKTNNSFNLGSADFGLASVYLGSTGGFTTRIKGSATTSYTLTFPAAVPGSKLPLHMDTSGNISTETQTGTITQAMVATRTTGTTVGAGGVAISDSSGTDITYFSNTTATFTAVTNLSVTITTLGNPVELFLQPSGVADGWSTITVANSSQKTIACRVRFMRGSTEIGNWALGLSDAATKTASPFLNFPSTGFRMIDVVSAGTYTYTVEVRCNDASGSQEVRVINTKLVALELK